jgi:ribonuclease P protein component
VGSERLLRRHRLRERREFLRCYRAGRRRTRPLLMLYSLPNQLDHARLGITASRKVGPAVVRNRAKRRVRDIFRTYAERPALAGLDLVVHLQPPAGGAEFGALRDQLLELLAGLTAERARTAEKR